MSQLLKINGFVQIVVIVGIHLTPWDIVLSVGRFGEILPVLAVINGQSIITGIIMNHPHRGNCSKKEHQHLKLK
jgi:hypothetical protein